MPINTRWKVAEAVEAAWNYARITKRRVSIEYAMIADINDQALARRPARRRADVVRRLGLGARQPDPAEPDARLEVDRVATRPTSASSSAGSEAKGVPTTVRDTRGREIDGACGQLAATRVPDADPSQMASAEGDPSQMAMS